VIFVTIFIFQDIRKANTVHIIVVERLIEREGGRKIMDNPNKFCFNCGKENDLNNFAFTETGETFHIICLNCKEEENKNANG